MIIVNKIDMVDAATKARVPGLVKKLNLVAKVIETRYSAIDVKEIININTFSFEEVAIGAGWLRSLHELTQMEIRESQKWCQNPRQRSKFTAKSINMMD